MWRLLSQRLPHQIRRVPDHRERSLDRLDAQMHRAGREVEEEEPSFTQIMVAIQGYQNKLIDHFGELKLECSFMKHDMQKLREKAQAIFDHHIAYLEEDTVRPMDTAVQVAKKTLSEHTLKMADMEDRKRRNNIRLVRFPEGAEGKHSKEFLEGWLKEHMAPGTFTNLFTIERAQIEHN